MMDTPQALSLSELSRRLVNAVATATGVHYVWVTAETSDVHIRNGHCYLELIDKAPDTGKTLAKIHAIIWASHYYSLAAKFMHETGQQFRSDLKVMVLVNAVFHPIFGLSLYITDINSAYTLGDVMQRRNRILQRLQTEGIISNNRELPWPTVPQRIAIISSAGAAGYGDFMKHLYHNHSRLKFVTRLFPAVLQGERTVPSVISALEQVCAECEQWDCVVIIRGGGATSDLLSFDDYDLAAHIAMFPLPVITGIGHDRDKTVLGYVSKIDVKTPTDAAQVLITCGEQALNYLHDVGSQILRAVTDRLSGCHQQLAYMAGALPAAATNALTRASNRLTNSRIALAGVGDRRIRPERMRLDAMAASLRQAVGVALSQATQRLDNDEKLVNVLSPQATLLRGYSITRHNGHSLSSASTLSAGDIIETIFAEGSISSRIIEK